MRARLLASCVFATCFALHTAEAAGFAVKEEKVGQLTRRGYVAATDDAMHYAFDILDADKKTRVVNDGITSPPWDLVRMPYTFGPTGKLAYVANRGNETFLAIDGKEWALPHHNMGCPIVWSSDGTRWAFVRSTPDRRQKQVVVDGREGAPAPLIGTLRFLPGNRLTYEVQRTPEASQSRLIDDVEVGLSPSYAASPDGKQLAVGEVKGTDAKTGAPIAAVKVAGKELWAAPGNVAALAYSPDSRKLAAIVAVGSSYGVYIDGRLLHGPLQGSATALAFSPDGRHLAWQAVGADRKLRLYRNGVASAHALTRVRGGFSFSPLGDLLALADRDGDEKSCVLFNDKLTLTGKRNTVDPCVRPDGQRVAFLFTGDKQHMVDIMLVDRDGKTETLNPDGVASWKPAFSPDSEHAAWRTFQVLGNELYIDKQPVPNTRQVVGGPFWISPTEVRVLIERDLQLLRLTVTLKP